LAGDERTTGGLAGVGSLTVEPAEPSPVKLGASAVNSPYLT
jgi:hypothetical protein